MVLVGAALALLINFAFAARRNSFPRQVTVEAVTRHGNLVAPIAEMDAVLAAAPVNGNLWFRFDGFESGGEDSVEMAYYRAAYVMYPQKVFATAPDTVVNHGRDIFLNSFRPDESFLRTNGIVFGVTFTRDPNGTISHSAAMLAPAR